MDGYRPIDHNQGVIQQSGHSLCLKVYYDCPMVTALSINQITSTPKMEMACPSETLPTLYETLRRHYCDVTIKIPTAMKTSDLIHNTAGPICRPPVL
jgi:hypothetical protein